MCSVQQCCSSILYTCLVEALQPPDDFLDQLKHPDGVLLEDLGHFDVVSDVLDGRPSELDEELLGARVLLKQPDEGLFDVPTAAATALSDFAAAATAPAAAAGTGAPNVVQGTANLKHSTFDLGHHCCRIMILL